MRILCVCGNGVGSSTMVKITVQSICRENNIKAEVNSCAFSEANAYLMNTDILIAAPQWMKMIPSNNAHKIEVVNLLDKKTLTELILKCIAENY